MGVRAVQIRHFYGKGSLAAVLAGAGVLAIGCASGSSVIIAGSAVCLAGLSDM